MFVSIVVPCYNELRNIEKCATFLNRYFAKHLPDVQFQIIFVDDGSKDVSRMLIGSLMERYKHIASVYYDKNMGKGFAVREGMKAAIGDVIFYMDADLSTDLNAIKDALDLIEKNGDEQFMIIGSRRMKESVVNHGPKLRQFMSKMCISFVNKMFGMGLTDTQCGFKCFDRQTASYLIANQRIFGFAFDVEYLHLCHMRGIPIYEIPVRWNNEEKSTVSPVKSSFRYILDVLKVKSIDYER